ncbi:uncharacterized protein L199_008453 [Kwoniella botswanensis]|uniref:uncharacterized protein n=1 Tax=Kwoniella botswanensis TaxID=1268659 RepID=UPI00315DF752
MPRRFHLLRRNSDSSPSSTPTPPSEDHETSSRVKNRLHALFSSSHPITEKEIEIEAGPSSPRSPDPQSRRDSRISHSGEVTESQLNIDINNQNRHQDDIHSHEFIKSKTYPLDIEHSNDNNSNQNGIAQSMTTPKTKQRDAIKVLMVTWNMGDALPKGDLSVLFGQIPPYQPETPTDEIPKLPVENAHPYHVVVVAGQECPTLSGAPRGLGGGLVKGVTLRHRKEKDIAKEKEKEKEKDKEREKDKEDKEVETDKNKTEEKPEDKEKLKTKEKARPDLKLKKDTLDVDRDDGGTRSADQDDSSDDDTPKDSSDQRSRANSPMTPHTPFLHRGQPAAKGWSQMLDDYFCGPNARTAEPAPTSYNSTSPVPRDTPFLPHPPPSAFPAHPSLLRSASAPITPITTPITIPSRPILNTPNLQLSPSPLARSRSSFESSSASSSTSDMDESVAENIRKGSNASPPQNENAKPKIQRPDIIIPNDEIQSTNQGNGSYVHVVKERLLGMYLSVYVYKGCEHLIQGLDKDLVTAGLAGGRVGNKGGIGISLKLADHRFLFVNSHLAAHTGRMHARLSNIAKIKSELRLDCFLPKDDPRAGAEDITDRFDTVFWCGDLNFRLELSRLHADWLIEQKKYSELLMWDQLKLAMKDPNLNPFPGFEEGPIDFPCTFKYDVWKSVRATNREIRKTLKRRKSSASAASFDMSSSVNVSKNLSYVPEGDAIEEVDADGDDPDQSFANQQLKRAGASDDEMTEGDFSRRSFESSRYTSGAGTDVDDESDDMPMTYKNHQHRPFEVALKEKTRHFLGLVKMDGILTPSPGRRLGKRTSVRRKISVRRRRDHHEEQYMDDSRRTSISSFVSQPDTDRPSTPTGSDGDRRVSTSSRFEGSNEDHHGQKSSPASNGLVPPNYANRSDSGYSSSPPKDKDRPPVFTRRLSIMKRTMSNKSVKDVNAPEDEDEEEVIDEVDRREGVYDTSKKQRVPSWCDRVLWKAHITPDLKDEESPPQSVELQIDSHTSFHRLSNVLSNLGGHLKLQMGRTTSMDPGPADRLNLRIRSSASPDGGSTPPRITDYSPSADNSVSFVASPPDSPTLSPLSAENTGEGLIPLPRKASPLRSSSASSPAKEGTHDHHRFFINSSAPPTRSPTRLIPSLGIGMIRSGSAPGESRPKLTDRPASASGVLPSASTSNAHGIMSSTPEKAHNGNRNKIIFDSPISPTVDRLKSSDNARGERKRSNSDSIGIEGINSHKNVDQRKGRMSDGHNNGIVDNNLSSPDKDRKSSLRIFDNDKRIRTISNASPTTTTVNDHKPLRNLKHPSSSSSHNDNENQIHRTTTIHTSTQPSASTAASSTSGVEGGGRERESDKNGFIRFLKDLPSWLHRSSSNNPHQPNEITLTIESPVEKRWKKGEVRCLHYGTIDDVGMRLLEGRSDHRPAIFAGAVYV